MPKQAAPHETPASYSLSPLFYKYHPSICRALALQELHSIAQPIMLDLRSIIPTISCLEPLNQRFTKIFSHTLSTDPRKTE